MKAIRLCIEENGSVGYIIANGPAFYNNVQMSFKKWHNDLIGTPSAFVRSGLETGRRSRRRKTIFHLNDLLVFRLDAASLEKGEKEGWLKGFQTGMANSNGNPRLSKLQIHLGKMPPTLLL